MKTCFRYLLLAVFAALFVQSASAYYDPRLGRWLSRDPIGEDGGHNLYAYCGNDPVNRHDPFGLSAWDAALIDGGWTPMGDPYPDQSGSMMVRMRHVIALTLGMQQNVTSDSVMPLVQARQLVPYSSVWSRSLSSKTLLAGTGMSGPAFSDISSYMENHPGFNMQMGVLESAPFALVGGYAFGGIRAVFGARAASYFGSALMGMGLGEWAKNDFRVTPRGLGQVAGGLGSGGLVAEAETQSAAGVRALADIFAPRKFTLNTYGDALRATLGPGRLSHPEEWAETLARAERLGVKVVPEPGRMAYEADLGLPGRLLLDPDASIGALRHEFKHVIDNTALGYPGLRILADRDEFWNLEFRGYMEEIGTALSIRDFDAASAILQEMRDRRMEILGR